MFLLPFLKFPIRFFRVRGESMKPTLKSGQLVMIWCYGKRKVGEVVVFKKEAQWMVKRIDHREGNRYFMKGDHRGESTDSDAFGAIASDQIIGKVLWAF
jgi:nickel-type superoxide dismutase maturation protease